MRETYDLTLNDILNAYANGLFPMADSAQDEQTYWVDPPMRGQLSIDRLHIPKRLKTTLRQYPYKVTHDKAFEQVITLCAESAKGRTSTWINDEIKHIFIDLHHAGFAHSVECWQKSDDDESSDTLVGGVYGLAIGALFCAESKFHRSTDASKVALAHLVARLWKAKFMILDTQFTNPHLKQFGNYEISKESYLNEVKSAIIHQTNFELKNHTEQGLITEYLDHLAQKV